jgi:hypothetical protein
MTKLFRIRFFGSQFDNLKSKNCGEPCRTIKNPKWLGFSAIGFLFIVAAAAVDARFHFRDPPDFNEGDQ